MKKDDKTKKMIIENSLVIIMMTLYIAYGIYYLPALILVIPVPFIVLGIRNELNQGVLAMVVTSMAIGMVSDTITGILLFLTFGPLILIISYGMKTRRKSLEILAVSTIVFLVVMLIIGYAIGGLSGIDYIQELEEAFIESINLQLERIQDMGVTRYQLLEAENLLEETYKFIMAIIPTMLAVFALVISYLNYLISAIILRKLGIGVVNRPRFSKFKLPRNFIPGVIVMVLGVLFMKVMEIVYYETILLNLIILIAIMFFIQGLSIVDFFLIRIRMALALRILTMVFVIGMVPITPIILLLGFIDQIINIRKIRVHKS